MPEWIRRRSPSIPAQLIFDWERRFAFHEGKLKTEEEIKDPEIKELFALRTADGALDRDAIIKATEAKRAPLAEAVKAAFVPVTHSIKILAK